jgi:hypothetical protein
VHDAVVVEYVVHTPQADKQSDKAISSSQSSSSPDTLIRARNGRELENYAICMDARVEIGAQVVGTTEDVVVGQLARLRSLTGDAVARMLWTG